MQEIISVTGMVLLAAPIGEHDKRIVILTKERGKISAFARGARKANSPLLAGTNPFAFGSFELYEGKNSYTLVHTHIQNYFRELAMDVEGAGYAFYFMELADYYTKENVDEMQMLKLLYQTFRALMHPSLSRKLIRRIFELKTMVINGEYPDMFQCVNCRSKEHMIYYSQHKNGLLCSNCKNLDHEAIEIKPATIYAMQFIILETIEKLYTFKVTDEVQKEIEMILNRHIAKYIDKKFKSLDILYMMVENIT